MCLEGFVIYPLISVLGEGDIYGACDSQRAEYCRMPCIITTVNTSPDTYIEYSSPRLFWKPNPSSQSYNFTFISTNKQTIKMKFCITAIALASTAYGFAPVSKASHRVLDTSLDAAGLFYASTTGNTETVAGYIADAAGISAEEIGSSSADEVSAFDSIIVGAPTWHTGADSERSGTDWDDWLYNTLPGMDMSGKKVAIFGVGDQESYCDNFCDAAGELYDLFEAKGAKIYGLTSQDGYNHEESKAVKDDKFCGLMCDEDNQYDMSEERAKNWIGQLKTEGFF